MITVANLGQADGDAESVGDVCDNCLDVYNPGQEDRDGDGVRYACNRSPLLGHESQPSPQVPSDDRAGARVPDMLDPVPSLPRSKRPES